MSSHPESWLRGPIAGIPDGVQPVAHALIAAREDVADAVANLTSGQLWLAPGGAASIGFHVMHLLLHAAEHATRHAGQIMTTAKIVRGLGL